MPESMTRRNLARVVVLVLCAVGVLVSCAKDPLRVDRNRPPQTYLVGAPAESASASYRVHLYWRGEDADGYIAGFLWSWDDSTVGAFRFTTKTDSIFELDVNDSLSLVGGGQQQPGQTKNHTFFIRAVDNMGKADPGLAIFNRRVIQASTEVPLVRFVGPLPSGGTIDTLCDHTPFEICWTGSDPDGYVKYYRWDVGVFSSSFSTDTCAVFNDPNDPNSVSLVNGLYTFTVMAADNAFSLSNPAVGGRTLFVVNNDPQTVIQPLPGSSDPRPVGYYFAPYVNGVAIVDELGRADTTGNWVPFYEGETIPYRSTVYFHWKGFDDACDSPSGIGSYSAVLRGTRNNNAEPYITGFRDVLCVFEGDTIRFTNNDPAEVSGKCSFSTLILDSLDAMNGAEFAVAARDLSGRADGTPATFLFNCNRAPTLSSLTVEDSPPGFKTFRWVGTDPEDGLTGAAVLHLDDVATQNPAAGTGQPLQSFTISDATFRALAPSNPHKLTVQVKDRAGALSPEVLEVTFDIPILP